MGAPAPGRKARASCAIPAPLDYVPDSLCVLFETGGVSCKGSNRNGELGDGTYTPRDDLRPVIGLPGGGVCALGEDGSVFCWGADPSGALGQGSKAIEREPVPLAFSRALMPVLP